MSDIASAATRAKQSGADRRNTANPPPNPSLRLVRLAAEKPAAAVEFLHARSEGVMDLIAHFWDRLSQTPPLSRSDLHLVAAVQDSDLKSNDVEISKLNNGYVSGVMLYVPKAHRADVLALDPLTSAAFVTYISQQGPRAIRSDLDNVSTTRMPTDNPTGDATKNHIHNNAESEHETSKTDINVNPPRFFPLIDLSGTTRGGAPTSELLAETPSPGGGGNVNAPTTPKVPIDFLTGLADGIRWMTPLLLAAVNRKAPAREMVNVVMQLPPKVASESDPAVRIARDADLPTLNRWRRQYKEERGILFDADLDAWVQTGRVFVYEHDKQVVAVAKFDLELPAVVEIGGVYTFPEFRTRGFGTRIVADLAARIRQMNKIPTLQVDEKNIHAVSLYEKLGWRSRGKLARVWLTG